MAFETASQAPPIFFSCQMDRPEPFSGKQLELQRCELGLVTDYRRAIYLSASWLHCAVFGLVRIAYRFKRCYSWLTCLQTSSIPLVHANQSAPQSAVTGSNELPGLKTDPIGASILRSLWWLVRVPDRLD